MSRRTYEKNGAFILFADDLENFVKDKRESWRATPRKARRRQRRYKNRLTRGILSNKDFF